MGASKFFLEASVGRSSRPKFCFFFPLGGDAFGDECATIFTWFSLQIICHEEVQSETKSSKNARNPRRKKNIWPGLCTPRGPYFIHTAIHATYDVTQMLDDVWIIATVFVSLVWLNWGEKQLSSTKFLGFFAVSCFWGCFSLALGAGVSKGVYLWFSYIMLCLAMAIQASDEGIHTVVLSSTERAINTPRQCLLTLLTICNNLQRFSFFDHLKIGISVQNVSEMDHVGDVPLLYKQLAGLRQLKILHLGSMTKGLTTTPWNG